MRTLLRVCAYSDVHVMSNTLGEMVDPREYKTNLFSNSVTPSMDRSLCRHLAYLTKLRRNVTC